MKLRVAMVGFWSVSWVLLSCWLFDPESHITRGPTFFLDNRLAESTRTAVALGALLGGLGGMVALTAVRSSPWWVLVVAILVGALVSGGSQVIHEWRYPVYGPPGQPAQPAWVGGAAVAWFGAVVGVPVGLLLMAVGEAASRRERKARSVSGTEAG